MTGKLHLPVPMMILAGPLYRGHLSVMSLLFVSTLLLSGPAWCSHLCYFGALDSMAAGRRKRPEAIRNKWVLKLSVLFMVIAAALILRRMQVPAAAATLLAGGFGVVGLGVIVWISRRRGSMVHCSAYCPLGTVVNLTRFIHPFRLTIDSGTCSKCMACTTSCNYDALNPAHINQGKPGATCTLCGDCITTCHSDSLRYRFLTLKPHQARSLYLFITISLHASTLALARI
jgi:polyferredoxin